MSTIREKLTTALADNDETWDDVVASNLDDEQMDTIFDDEGYHFYVWTKDRVYYTDTLDDCYGLFINYLPRNPPEEKP